MTTRTRNVTERKDPTEIDGLVAKILSEVIKRTPGKITATGIKRLAKSIRGEIESSEALPTMRISGPAKSKTTAKTEGKTAGKGATKAPIILSNPIPSRAIKAAGTKVKRPMLGIRTPNDPFVPVSRSVQKDWIICLEDGKKFKMMKRHLRANYGMTPEDYRAKWNLPADYPMVAPGYAAEKSEYAQLQGLGTNANKAGGKTRVKDLQAQLA